MWNSSTYDCECNKAYKIEKYLDIKSCSCEKFPFGKLTLACTDKMSNTTETSLEHKNNMRKKNFIHSISFAITFILLIIVISISCYYYHTKQKHFLPFNCSRNKLK